MKLGHRYLAAVNFLIAAGAIWWTFKSGPTGRAFSDEFNRGLTQWVVEQQPGGTVRAADGILRIEDHGGCTVWFKPKLSAEPLIITYEARVLSTGRVSDLNCFWLASDPKHPDLLAPANRRDGKFANYDSLRTYYVGYGANDNTTTRFRRYDGTGARPLRDEHDKRAPEFMLKPDQWYKISVTVERSGRVTFNRDGEMIFDWNDSALLSEGWFGFRTVNSQIEIRHFRASVGLAY